MKIIEKFVAGKQSEETCEDGWVATDDFVAVVDGSTSKTPFRLVPEVKNGRLAMQLIISFIRELPGESSVFDFCKGITDYFAQEYQKRGMLSRMAIHPEERLTASAIVYSRERREVWMVGDCQALIDGVLHENSKPYEQEVAQRRVALIRQQGLSPAVARKKIEPLLIQSMLDGQNKTYAVIDGFEIYMPGVKVIEAKDSKEIVLASDGYPFLLPTWQESEQALRRQLQDDPQNVSQFIATKGLVAGNQSFDDRTYVRFLVP